jgi:hypothetical protein
MRTFKQPVAALLLALAAVLCPAQTKTEPAPQPAPAKEVKSLLRKDLLGITKPEAAPPKRNIFAPRTGAIRPAPAVPSGSPQHLPGLRAEGETGVTDNAPVTPPVVVVNLRYIGVIYSSRRLVALVNFEGRAIAVVEGEIIGDGIRVGRVTRQEIEVVLPDSSTRTFPLEGE